MSRIVTPTGTSTAKDKTTMGFRGGQQLPPVLVYSQNKLGDLEANRAFGNLYVFGDTFPAVTTLSGDTVFHIDGIGVYKNRVIESVLDVLPKEDLDLKEVFSNTHGAVAGYTINFERRIVRILPDPLGGAIVYRYAAEGVDMLSTSMNALVILARQLGLKLTKSATWFAELIATESGGMGAESSYEEISTLAAGDFLEGDVEVARVVRYKSAIWDDLGDAKPTPALFDAIVHEMASNARAYGRRPGPKVAHLSAGGDSRLSAAALVHESVDQEFNFYCAGNSGGRENVIAGEVAQHLGLCMGNDSGLRTPVVPRTAFESVAVALMDTEGIKHYSPFRTTLGSDGLILTGMYGGILRGFYSPGLKRLEKKDGRSVLGAIWSSRLHDPTSGILNGNIVDRTATSLDSKLSLGRDRGIYEDALGDYLYASVRQRYFGAHTLMETSRYVKQASLLYSPAALKYALSLSLDHRESGRLVFDLYNRLCRRALEIRFDSEKFGQDVLRDPQFPRRLSYPNLELEPTDNGLIPARADFGITPTTTIKKSHKVKARKLGLPAWRVAYEPIARRMVSDWLKKSPEVAGQVFDLKNLNNLVERPCTTTATIKLVTRIGSYLPWLEN